VAGLSGMMGTAGGAGGSGFSGPDSANIKDPVSRDMLNQANNGVNSSLDQQNSLLAALQGQNGLANQSSVYNQYQNIANGTGPNPAQAQLAQATGANTANQAALMAGQRGSSANTGLIARQAAMQGGANQQAAAGQAATMQANQSLGAIGQMGGIANAQAANQIGQTNANAGARQAQQSNLFNANAGVNTANVANQSNINNVNGQLANTQLQGQQAMVGGLMNTIGGGMLAGAKGGMTTKAGFVRPAYEDGGEVQPEQAQDFGNFQPSSAAAPAPMDGGTPNFSGANAGADAIKKGASTGSGIGKSMMKSVTGMMGGGGGAAGAAGAAGSSGGGLAMLALLAEGGPIDQAQQLQPVLPQAEGQPVQPAPQQGPQSKFGKFLSGTKDGAAASGQSTPQFGGNDGAKALYEGASSLGKGINSQMKGSSQPAPQKLAGGPGDAMSNKPNSAGSPEPSGETMMAAEGGRVPALVSPGEKYLSPKKVEAVQKGANPMEIGETIPGKPKVKGAKNSYANDTVPKTLEEGGIVLPRSVTQSKNPHWAAHKFVSDIMAKKGMLPPRKPKGK
jgi:hypothetical protein